MVKLKYDVKIIALVCILFIIILVCIHILKSRIGLSLQIMNKDKYLLLPYNTCGTNSDDLFSLLNINTLPILSDYHKIPNILFQIYMFYTAPIPTYMFDAIQKYAHNYKHILFNEKDAIIFLSKYFDRKVVKRFNDLSIKAHKADLLRYCFLYVYGGVYLDIKTVLLKPLDDIFTNKTYLYSTISVFKHTIHNGTIATKPRNTFFLRLIWYIVHIPIDVINHWKNYLSFCRDFYMNIQQDINNSVKTGYNKGLTQEYYLFEERCPLLSNKECNNSNIKKVCCAIYDKNDKIFITRDPNFPWS